MKTIIETLIARGWGMFGLNIKTDVPKKYDMAITNQEPIFAIIKKGERDLVYVNGVRYGRLPEYVMNFSLADIIESNEACKLLFGKTGVHCNSCGTNMFINGSIGFSECCQNWVNGHIPYYQHHQQQLVIMDSHEQQVKYILDNMEAHE